MRPDYAADRSSACGWFETFIDSCSLDSILCLKIVFDVVFPSGWPSEQSIRISDRQGPGCSYCGNRAVVGVSIEREEELGKYTLLTSRVPVCDDCLVAHVAGDPASFLERWQQPPIS